ncbi:Cell wall-associated hydrolase (invasion-associated protein) [Phaeobacter piscinae]|uniref:Cell wall-associated hydrolase (Invasion-associated protein) n=1 Tax=Phaeobacter piscinae TaxID=1580596 RepID=A0ABN5DBV5_9RHOB|nr:NlpC/P60 family protein [Phaeobacter piscinae]ATG34269.1 Cell wall-associated hydrolase (invasion-associated protein) [Phaeobacter piscinae]AUQ84789.1 Cell wall-associated hydrolase (invasion-associated protein) [Phaeobacter piscinae]AUR22673.1 Cell wall-associated hydrolase (invasion-associated protein) [Phaeobacter piscinae]
MDPRRTPANDRVVAAHLALDPDGRQIVEGQPAQVCLPVVNLLRRPDGPRDRQLLLGAEVTIYDDHDGWAFVQAVADRYVGYIPTSALEQSPEPVTHRICTPATHAYSTADMKSADLCSLSHGSRLRVSSLGEKFAETNQGYVPLHHLRPISQTDRDPVAVAQLFLGTPYLWGGNSRWGIDCSGLVQEAMLACGVACPGDSDQQEHELGDDIPLGNAAVPTDLQSGDLLFWKGHVALVQDPETMIHANAYHMAVALEPVAAAVERIMSQGDGPVTGHRRVIL